MTPHACTTHLCRLLHHSTSLRLLMIMGVMLLLLLPLIALKHTTHQQQQQTQHTLQDITNTLGTAQTLTAPVLIVPYTEHFTSIETINDANGESRIVSKDIFNDKTAVLLPDTLDIRGDLKSTSQTEQNLTAHGYHAKLTLSGLFDYAPLLVETGGTREIKWEQAYLSIGLNAPHLITDAPPIVWGDTRLALQPSTLQPKLLPTGIHARIGKPDNKAKTTTFEFKISLNFNGNHELKVTPLGKTTTLRLTSTELTPHLIGERSPTTYNLSANGFNAEWKIPHIVRDYPQTWLLEDSKAVALNTIASGIQLAAPVDEFTQRLQVLTYCPWLIMLALFMYFTIERQQTTRFHLLHYMGIGSGVLGFYVLYSALFETMNLPVAYTLASTSILSMSAIYTYLLTRHGRTVMFVLLGLGMGYALVYAMLWYPSESNLIGAIGLVALGILFLYITSRVQPTVVPVETGTTSISTDILR